MSRFVSRMRAMVAFLGSALLACTVLAAFPAPAGAHEGHGHVLIFNAAPAGPWHDAAIAEGTPKLQAALEAEGMDVTVTDDASVFTDESLAQYDAMVAFQINGDPWNADQKAAMERWMQAGGGIAAVHNATDMRGNYAWWDEMVGALMPGHSAQDIPAVVRTEDSTHPSTQHFAGTPEATRWMRNDEWYNFDRNVRGDAHVLQTMDESTYEPGGNAQGYDHPITWCKPYDGGRFWSTALGHFPKNYDEPQFMQMLVGGVKYVAGLEEGDCGGTVWDNFERVPLDQNTSAPFAIDIADDGRVFYTELVRGQIRMYDPSTQSVSTVLEVPVYSGGEDGMLGIALDPNFSENGHVFVYRSPQSPDDSDPANFWSTIARFTMENGSIDPATEKEIIRIPARRLPDEPGHTGGGLDFDADGNLYIGVGDDVNPHSEPSGGYAPLSERDGTFHDARETSANTNDLRGKLLRIHPNADGSGYTIPEGNLFPESEDAQDKTLPEIYAMGFRNPFRFSVDQETGWISMADYSPDNGTDAPNTRGPAGIAEWNLIKSPGNYGWPLCMGQNEPFRDVDYRTSPVTVGEFFDCDNPVNDSVRNTGLTNLPPARGADMAYGYQRSSVPGVIPQGGGLAPMGGPFYRYDETLESDTKFPEYYDGKPFFYEWARNKMYSIQLKDPAAGEEGQEVEKVNPFLPETQFMAPIDSKFGPDGSMYVLDWGGGFGRDNPSSGLYRVDYVSGSRSPIARITTDKDSGPAPLTVEFDGTGSTDPENEELTYAWDFDGDGTTDATTATASHTFETAGRHDVRLTVTDPAGKDGTTTVPITVGNTRPEVSFNLPPNGAFFDFGDDISWDVEVTDPEDGEIDGADVIIQPALGHDEHAHPTTPYSGFTGTTPTSLGGHAADENIFFAIDARYTDSGGEGGADQLTGSATTLIFPKLRQAEFFDEKSEGATVAPSRDPAGGDRVVAGTDGDWVSFDPVNFHQIDELLLRVQATEEGGAIELRRGAPDGELLATADVPVTGATNYEDVSVDVSTLPAETMNLYFVFTGPSDVKLNFFEAVGKGAGETAPPRVAITEPAQGVELTPDSDVTVAAEASQQDGEIASVEFFQGDTLIGEDTTAPYSVTWHTPVEEGLYDLTAVATNTGGESKTSRVVSAQVGELFGSLVPFTNVDGTFERIQTGFRITGAGNDTWQGVDQYSTLFEPGGAEGERWDAIVRVDAHTMTHQSAKAGLIVRNDMTQPGVSPGYAIVALRPSGGVEFLSDTDGNGQVETSEGGGSSTTPKWLKLSRRGGDYSAYWSSNGTDWSKVGDTVTLAGAADRQDVGFMEMSHEAAAKSADFSEFSIDHEPTDPEPEEPSEPLTCVSGPVSDEFDDGGVSPKWFLRTDGGPAITQSDGALQLPVGAGDINEGSTGPISFAGQPLPEGDWTATTKLTLEHTTHWQWAGIVVHQSDDEYNKIGFVRHQNGNRFVEFQSETGGQRTTPDAPVLPADHPTTIQLRLTNTGGTLTGAYSADGEAWTDLEGSLELKTGAGTRLGLMAAGDLGTTPVTAGADWFRVTPDNEAAAFEPNDEFDGDALDGCRWAESVRYNSHTAAVADGHLTIDTEPGDINGANPVQPRNFILQQAPEGDWVAETKFKAPLKHRWQLAGLLMYTDDDNYVKSDVVAYNNPGAPLDLRAELAAEKGGQGVGGGDQIDIADSTESGYWHVRVTKTGDQYTAEVSDGGVNWTPIGDGISYDQPLHALGLMAIGPNQEEPVSVEFDWFHLDSEAEPPGDTTAPTSTITWTPAEPDGENGWYVTAPRFELTADDGDGSGVASIEYRLDAGPWTAYTEPVVLDDGVHQVEYRSTDEAGNVEEARAVDRSVDTTVPRTRVTVAGPTITLSAEDATSGIDRTEYRVDEGEWTAYDGPVTLTDEGSHTVNYRSVDLAGNAEGERSITVVVAPTEPEDTTAPTVRVTGVQPRGYLDARNLTLRWSATDEGSGIATVVASLDGEAIRRGRLELWRLPLGVHTLEVSATDKAGNTTTETVRFRTRTSIGSMRTLVRRFADGAYITPAVERRLIQHLGKAQRHRARGQDKQAVRQLRGFRDDAQRIRSSAIRTALKRDATWLIRRWR